MSTFEIKFPKFSTSLSMASTHSITLNCNSRVRLTLLAFILPQKDSALTSLSSCSECLCQLVPQGTLSPAWYHESHLSEVPNSSFDKHSLADVCKLLFPSELVFYTYMIKKFTFWRPYFLCVLHWHNNPLLFSPCSHFYLLKIPFYFQLWDAQIKVLLHDVILHYWKSLHTPLLVS